MVYLQWNFLQLLVMSHFCSSLEDLEEHLAPFNAFWISG